MALIHFSSEPSCFAGSARSFCWCTWHRTQRSIFDLSDCRATTLESGALQAQLGLAHAYSRAKVKFNVNRVDNMIIQAIALLDTLDKDINTFVMRVREWYSWHFPELVKIVNDNYQYSKLALLIKDKSSLSEDKVSGSTPEPAAALLPRRPA